MKVESLIVSWSMKLCGIDWIEIKRGQKSRSLKDFRARSKKRREKNLKQKRVRGLCV